MTNTPPSENKSLLELIEERKRLRRKLQFQRIEKDDVLEDMRETKAAIKQIGIRIQQWCESR